MPIVRAMTRTLRPTTHAVRPALLRLGVGAFSAVHNLRRRAMFRTLHRQGEDRWAPVGVAQLVNLAATAGLAHRVTGPLNAALQLWTITYRNSWGMVFHNDNTLTMHQMALGLGRSADALSVDALVTQRTLLPNRVSRHYGGIATVMNLATCAVYLISGVAKVRSPQGWAWASGDTLREQIAADAIRKESFGGVPPKFAGEMYRSKGQFGLLAIGALVIELGAPLSLVDRRLGALFSAGAWGMHVGIRMIMGIKFSYNTSGVAYLPYLTNMPALSPR
ncbi:hypothetical protein [Gulosibacter massiliensis]|uniref:hypothetical protein n=1 Tax=Gulosibacter massiliensis TaxID=2479839 RepID=UPI000F63C3A1|nr:hypothetical protein [Gulosibacter massiliensis]